MTNAVKDGEKVESEVEIVCVQAPARTCVFTHAHRHIQLAFFLKLIQVCSTL